MTDFYGVELDVTTNPTDQQMLVYDAVTGKFKPQDIPAPGISVNGTPTDGQLIAWSATLNSWVPANPAAAQVLASAKNNTGTGQAMTGVGGTLSSILVVTGTSIVVPASNGREVTLEYGGQATQTSATGDGTWNLDIQETTSGNVTTGGKGVRLPGTNAASVATVAIDGVFPLGIVAAQRTFRLITFLWCPASNTPTVNLINGGTQPSYLRAVSW